MSRAPARAGVSLSGRFRDKYAAGTLLTRGIVAGMDDLEHKYRALVERINRYPMSEAARARVLAQVVAACRWERAAMSDAVGSKAEGSEPKGRTRS